MELRSIGVCVDTFGVGYTVYVLLGPASQGEREEEYEASSYIGVLFWLGKAWVD